MKRTLASASLVLDAIAALLVVLILIKVFGPFTGLSFLLLMAVLTGARLWFGPGSGRVITAIVAAWIALATAGVLLIAPWMPLAVWDTLHRPTVREWATCDAGVLHHRTQVENDPAVSVENTGQEC